MKGRRKHSPELKLRVDKEAVETGNVSVVTRRSDLSSSIVSKWFRQHKQYGEAAFSADSNGQTRGQQFHHSENGYRQLGAENERLKKILGDTVKQSWNRI